MSREAFVPKAATWTFPPPVDVDAHCWLSGNEDCDVDVQCRTCDRRGEPIAWYSTGTSPNPYDESRVPTAHTIYQLYALAYQHVREMHVKPQ